MSRLDKLPGLQVVRPSEVAASACSLPFPFSASSTIPSFSDDDLRRLRPPSVMIS